MRRAIGNAQPGPPRAVTTLNGLPAPEVQRSPAVSGYMILSAVLVIVIHQTVSSRQFCQKYSRFLLSSQDDHRYLREERSETLGAPEPGSPQLRRTEILCIELLRYPLGFHATAKGWLTPLSSVALAQTS